MFVLAGHQTGKEVRGVREQERERGMGEESEGVQKEGVGGDTLYRAEVGNSSSWGPDWCHSFAPAITTDSNNPLIKIFSLECNLMNQLCLLGMEKKFVTAEDWSCPPLV